MGLSKTAQMARAENILYDWRVKNLNHSQNPNKAIKQILVDQKSLEWMSSQNSIGWPWPREVYAHIVSFLKEGGAKVVAFDMIFSEPSVYGVEDDERFAKALRSVKSVGSVVNAQDGGHKAGSIPAIDEAFFAKGFVNATTDEDGSIRRADLCKNGFLSLSAAIYEAAENKKLSISCEPKIINYRGASLFFDSYNAAEIVASKAAQDSGEKPKINPLTFKDSIVLIGLSAEGLHDLKPTPVSADFVGVEIHSTILDNIFKNDFARKNSVWVLAFWSLFFAMLCAFVVYTVERLALSAALYAALFAAIFGLSILYHAQDIWFGAATVTFGAALSLILSSALKYVLEGRQKSYIKSAFGKYISPIVVEELVKSPETLRLGGEERRLSIFFSDIAGFTSISERLEPAVLVSLLNTYLDRLSTVILGLGGTIDKYEGDAIIAFWNAPVLQQNHADLALKAAIGCQEALKGLNAELGASLGIALNTRIGINTGKVIVGNIGSSLRFDYSFIGDAGNFASRLEGVNKVFATKILVSEDTKEALAGDFGLREVSLIKVVGKSKAVRIFEPCDYLDETQKGEFAKALKAFYDGEPDFGAALFSSLSSVDPVSQKYLTIINDIKNGELRYDGGLVLTSK